MATGLTPTSSEQAVFIVPDDGAEIDVRIASETVWLTQAQIAKLFDVTRENINIHLTGIYRDGELDQEATCKENLQVRTEGGRQVRRKTLIYDLDAIISVGYRVNSKTATAFRQWATRVLKQRLIADHRKRIEAAERYLAGLKNIELLAHHADTDAAAVLDADRALCPLLAPPPAIRRKPVAAAAPTQPTKRMAEVDAHSSEQGHRAGSRSHLGTERAKPRTCSARCATMRLASILGNLEQTWGGVPLYPNVETRAANLLYHGDQGSSVLRWQQAHRQPAVSPLPQQER